MFDSIATWATSLMETLGAPGAGLAVALENLFPPIPSEIILPLAGFTAAQGKLSLVAAMIWTTLGSVAGAAVLYGLGRLLGRERIRAIAARLPLVDVEDLDKAESWFYRHGPKAVFFGRMIPLVRSLISVPAGIERMRMPLFLLLTALGSAIWNCAFIVAGYVLGENWTLVERYVGVYSKGVVAIVAVAIVVFVALRIRRGQLSRKRRMASTRRL
jgi:membrane protein DedA with SNARE-associated domain